MDTYLDPLSPSENNGEMSYMHTAAPFNGDYRWMPIMKFPTSDASPAKVCLALYYSSGSERQETMNVRSYPTNWDENAVTWGTKPGTPGNVLVAVPHKMIGAWYYADVTADYINHSTAGVVGYALTKESGNYASTFASKEWAGGQYAPQLEFNSSNC